MFLDAERLNPQKSRLRRLLSSGAVLRQFPLCVLIDFKVYLVGVFND